MLDFVTKHKVAVIGSFTGAILGFMYYYFIGCSNGSCLISSNPLISTPYGALLGFLVTGVFKKKENADS
jgi:hypothetical protein